MCGPVKLSRVWWWWELLKVTSHTLHSLSRRQGLLLQDPLTALMSGHRKFDYEILLGWGNTGCYITLLQGGQTDFPILISHPMTRKISTRLKVNWNFISRRNPHFWQLSQNTGPHCVRWVATVRCKSVFFLWIFFAHPNLFPSTWHRGHNLPRVQDIWRILIWVSKCFLCRHGCLSSLIRGTGIISRRRSWRQMFGGSRDDLRQSSNRALPWCHESVTPGSGPCQCWGVWDIFMSLTPG